MSGFRVLAICLLPVVAHGGGLVEADLSAPIPFCVSADAALTADDPQFDLHPDAFAQYRRYVAALCFPTRGETAPCSTYNPCSVAYDRAPDPAPVPLPWPGLLLTAALAALIWKGMRR